MNNRDMTIAGTPAKIPNPNKYNIGRNCVAVSPAKLKVAENRRYKYLIDRTSKFEKKAFQLFRLKFNTATEPLLLNHSGKFT